MPAILSRNEAIEVLAERDLKSMSKAERGEQLFCMTVEDWVSDPAWPAMDPEIHRVFEEGLDIENPTDARFDPILLLWLRSRYAAALNSYLLELLRDMKIEVEQITGDAEEGIACPCCGYCTLGSRGEYEICIVCWWEDDGQDNDDAHLVFGGPNYELSLTRARLNFLKEGISIPRRTDLRRRQEPTRKYAKGREFLLDDTSEMTVLEPEAGWRGKVTDENG